MNKLVVTYGINPDVIYNALSNSETTVIAIPERFIGLDKGTGADLKTFKPKYVVDNRVIESIEKVATSIEEVFLVTNFSPLGECVAYLLSQRLDNIRTIVVNEATVDGIMRAFNIPIEIDENACCAHLARRAIERMSAYKLDRFVRWRIAKKASLSRLQAIILEIVADKWQEAVDSGEKWRIKQRIRIGKGRFATLTLSDLLFETRADALDFSQQFKERSYVNTSTVQKDNLSAPAPPTIYSLYQYANKELNISLRQLFDLCEGLFQGGYITYYNTDSVCVSPHARALAQEYIARTYSPELVSHVRRVSSGISNRDECIRPIDLDMSPSEIADVSAQLLYKFVYDRFVASQMTDASIYNVNYELRYADHVFCGKQRFIESPGWLLVYGESAEDVPWRVIKSTMIKPAYIATEKTERSIPPNEWDIIHQLNDIGIKLSDYADCLMDAFDKLLSIGYVERDNGRLIPTALGIDAIEFIKEYFPDIVDLELAAKLEQELNDVAAGNKTDAEVLRNFWEMMQLNSKGMARYMHYEMITDYVCPLCGGDIILQTVKNDKIFVCENWSPYEYQRTCNYRIMAKYERDGKPVPIDKRKVAKKKNNVFLKKLQKGMKLRALFCPICQTGRIKAQEKDGKIVWVCNNSACNIIIDAVVPPDSRFKD